VLEIDQADSFIVAIRQTNISKNTLETSTGLPKIQGLASLSYFNENFGSEQVFGLSAELTTVHMYWAVDSSRYLTSHLHEVERHCATLGFFRLP
jgi:hypothetical protein